MVGHPMSGETMKFENTPFDFVETDGFDLFRDIFNVGGFLRLWRWFIFGSSLLTLDFVTLLQHIVEPSFRRQSLLRLKEIDNDCSTIDNDCSTIIDYIIDRILRQ